MNRALFFLLFSTAALFAENTWPGIPFSEVRAYAWPDAHLPTGARGTAPVILPGMALRPDVVNKDGAQLSSAQVTRLRKAVTVKAPLHDIRPLHYPHNAFIFYDATKKPVAFIEVSFCRLRHTVAPKGVSIRPDLRELAKLFDELKLPMGEFADFAAFNEFFRDHSQ
jgi:hypothetical protein